jgi:hypothetical protein
VYVADDIVLASRPIAPTDNCAGGFGAKERAARVDNLLGKKASRQSAAAPRFSNSNAKETDKVGAKIASAEPAHKGREPNLYSGIALIYFGPMTVNSRVHDLKIEQGMSYGSAVLPRCAGALTSAQRSLTLVMWHWSWSGGMLVSSWALQLLLMSADCVPCLAHSTESRLLYGSALAEPLRLPHQGPCLLYSRPAPTCCPRRH